MKYTGNYLKMLILLQNVLYKFNTHKGNKTYCSLLLKINITGLQPGKMTDLLKLKHIHVSFLFTRECYRR